MTSTKFLCALMLMLPAVAMAQAYKCKQPNGSISFQDQPCQTGSAESQVKVRTPSGQSAADARSGSSAGQRQLNRERDAEMQRMEDEVREHNQKVVAEQRAARCNNARRNLGVLKEQAPVFRYDNNGEKQYLDDSNRQAEIEAAQRKVSEYCS
ncbi:MAG: DUF4124 domain-containing protein [Rhodocyclaceae bacterium]|nr:DUF4124 domain-containing protein [Rhodocyclaceae bacterium]